MQTLHDATLVSILVDWVAATATFSFRPARTVVVAGLRELHVPRDLPWGRSESVNEVTLATDVDGERIAIEMQSGDTIVAVGRAVSERAS